MQNPNMKKIAAVLLCSLLTTLGLRAEILFSDALNYPNGCIETDGLWYAYSPATPHHDAFVTNDLLILNQTNYDAVAAPTNQFVNNTGGTIVYGSFTINVSSLPTLKGGYFSVFQDTNSDQVGRVFIDTTNTVTPGTYRLGIANIATSLSTAGVTNFPLDLATGITYQVIFSYDTDQSSSDPTTGANLWVNPSMSDLNDLVNEVYANDSLSTATAGQTSIQISQIGFSQYENQGIVAIGNVNVGTAPTDFGFATVPAAPVIGIQPQGSTNYLGDSTTLYVAASGIDETYQWYSNSVPLVDDGVTVVGSTTPVLNLSNLQATATYYVIVSDSATSTTSSNAVVGVNTVPTLPFFTVQPQNQTNSLFTTVTMSALADGTGPLTYQWFFAPTNLPITFSALSGQTSTTLSLPNVAGSSAGYYYVAATGGAGTTDSLTNTLVLTPPVTVTIAQLHSLMQTNNSGSYTIGLGQYVTVSGRVTTFGPLSASSKTYAEFYIQDGTGGSYVFLGGYGTNSVPAPGSLVTITGPCQVYSGQLEIDPAIGTVVNGVTNGITISTNAAPAMPAVQMPSFSLLATNPLCAAAIQIQCALVTFTNVYIYGSKTGGAIGNGGKFYTNGYTSLYITQGPYSNPANTNYMELFVPAYGYGGLSTNLWGQIVPGQAYQLTGVMANFDGASELDATRLQDFVATPPAPFAASMTVTNGSPTLAWPALAGSTYSVYGATNLLGPWTQTFGLSYYPSVGLYPLTNGAAAAFYKISTP